MHLLKILYLSYVSLAHFVTFNNDTMTALSITNFLFLTIKKIWNTSQVPVYFGEERAEGGQKSKLENR